MEEQSLLVIIPALNEEAVIGDVIDRVFKSMSSAANLEILVVDDGSTDATVRIAKEKGCSVTSHSKNMGVGKAIQTGLSYAAQKGVDLAVNIDGDGQFAPEDIPRLLEPIIRGEADMVTASRFMDKNLRPDMPKVKYLGNKLMSRMISSLTGERFHDVSCGFRAYSREAIQRLILTGQFTYTQEMFLFLCYRGMKIMEVPLLVRGVREHGKSRVASNLFKYGFKTLKIIFGFIRDYKPGVYFGGFSLACFTLGLGLGVFLLVHWLATGFFTPHKWAGFASGFFIMFSAVIFLFGQLAAMIERLRLHSEEQIYLTRKIWGSGNNENDR